MPPIRDAVPVKWRSTSARVEPDRLEDLRAAVGLDVEMPIFEIVFSRPLPIALRTAISASSRSSRWPSASSSSPSSTSSPTVSNIRYGLTTLAP